MSRELPTQYWSQLHGAATTRPSAPGPPSGPPQPHRSGRKPQVQVRKGKHSMAEEPLRSASHQGEPPACVCACI